MEERLFRDTEPQVFVTNPENPLEGRIFVWAWTQWFERIEGEWGNVAFTPVTISESGLREWLPNMENGPLELSDADDDIADMVSGEFAEQVPLYPEGEELFDYKVTDEPGQGDFEHD
ncbi:MAG: hypothetical protein R6U89_06375 [Dehalococcoidia bacterium]